MNGTLRHIESIHALACRHCNAFRIPQGHSFASQIFLGDKPLDSGIEAIESCSQIVDEISIFCERCHRISVISYECYTAIEQNFGSLKLHTRRATSSSFLMYTNAFDYYFALVVKHRKKQQSEDTSVAAILC